MTLSGCGDKESVAKMRFLSLTLLVLSWAASLPLADPPKIRFNDMTLGAQYAQINEEGSLAFSANDGTGYGYHAGMEVSLIDILLFRDLDWPVAFGDVIGMSNWAGYASYGPGPLSKRDSYYLGVGFNYGLGVILALTQDIDIGFKYIKDTRVSVWGQTDQDDPVGGAAPVLMARWMDIYGEIGRGSADSYKVDEKLGMTSLKLRYLFGSDPDQFFGVQSDFGTNRHSDRIAFDGTQNVTIKGKTEYTTFIALYWGMTY